MARQIITGSPGDIWVNDTGKVWYQFFASLHNTCGVCLQYHHQIGPWWPIPLHWGCRCHQTVVKPGDAARQPFVDYRKLLRAMPHDQHVAAVGASNYRLIERGVVPWDEVVTEGRIRTLREVVSRRGLTVDQMVKAGVRRSIAEKAYESVHTSAHELAEAQRREALGRILRAGVPQQALVDELSKRIAARATVTPIPPPAGPAGPAPVPVAPPVGPAGGPALAAELARHLAAVVPAPAPAVPAGELPTPAPSRAKIVHSDRAWKPEAAAVLGQPVTGRDLLDLAGAAEGRATISLPSPGEVKVIVQGDHYGVNRSIKQGLDGKPVLDAHAFFVDPSHQGQGIGADVFARMVATAQRLGVARIRTHAVRGPDENGYWTWARFGYDAPIPADVRARLPAALARAERISDLMATPEGSDWWKAHGRSIDLTFDLTPGSRSRRIWDTYRAQKATARSSTPTSARPTSPPPIMPGR